MSRAISFCLFSTTLALLVGCEKTVDRQDIASGIGSTPQSVPGVNVVGSTTWVPVGSVSCVIGTFFPSYWRNNLSESFSFQCVQSLGTALGPTQCQLDGGTWYNCDTSTTATVANLSQGMHYFRVQASDTNGSIGMSPYIPWGTDFTAPVINSAGLVAATNSSASFSFSGSDQGGSGLWKYRCQLPPTYANWQDCTAPNYYLGLPASTAQIFSVQALDNAGNVSAAVNVNFTTAVPTGANDGCVFTSPVAPYSQIRSQTLNFACNSPLGPIVSTECRLDSGAWSTCNTLTSDQLTNLSEGDHLFNVRYVDSLGNRGAPASVSWRVNSLIPVVQITSVQVNTLTPSFAFSGADSAGGPLQSFSCQLTGPGGVIVNWTPCTSPITYSSGITQNSAYTFNVQGVDFAGNVSLTTSYNWTSPTTQAPSCVIQTSFANGYSNQSAPTISFLCSSVAPIVSYQCQLNGQAWSACTSSTTQVLSGLQSGTTYTFAVQATDAFNNVSPPTLPLTWGVDLVAPSVTITSTNVAGSSVTVPFSATDTGGSGLAFSSCQLDGVSAWANCTSPVTYTGLTVGNTYTVRVRATDNAGNVSPQAATSFVFTPPPYSGPACSIVAPAAINGGWTNQTSLSFQFGCAGGQSPAGGFQCELNTGGWAACASPTGVTTGSSGAQSYFVRAIDGNGTSGPVQTVNWGVDTIAPTATITSLGVTQKVATFTFNAADTGGSGLASAQCQLSGNNAPGTWVNCTSPVSYNTTSFSGNYVFSVRSTDIAGNVSLVHSYSWNSANVAPMSVGRQIKVPTLTPPATPATSVSPVWAESVVGGYYDTSGRVSGNLKLSAMRAHGGTFISGEPLPVAPVMVNAAEHVCFQPGYMSTAFPLCSGMKVHNE